MNEGCLQFNELTSASVGEKIFNIVGLWCAIQCGDEQAKSKRWLVAGTHIEVDRFEMNHDNATQLHHSGLMMSSDKRLGMRKISFGREKI